MEMYDSCEKGSSEWCGGEISSEATTTTKKTCADCGTSKTPLWRGGPAGPKSLCNACGIRSRKKRRAAAAAIGGEEMKKKKKKKKMSNKYGAEWLTEVVMHNRSSFDRHHHHHLAGEEEQAAVLLMALSCASSVYAL